MSEESETESESSDSETESETYSETDSDGVALPSEGSMVVMDAQRPDEEVRVQRREREIGRGGSRKLREYIDEDEAVIKSSYSPRPPETPRSGRQSEHRRQKLAIIEVQDEVELNDSRLQGSMQEERRLAVPGASRRKIIEERQVDTCAFQFLCVTSVASSTH
jgi:hypothetical protein